MTEIEQKALALVNEVNAERNRPNWRYLERSEDLASEALCRAIEQHEAFKREVSDVAEGILNCTNINKRYGACLTLNRFILPKPKPVDPLVEVAEELRETYCATVADWAKATRAALAKRGLEVREIEG